MGKKCCCNPALPCCCGNSPREWIADFGAGGWTDNRCDGCDEIQGEFTLEHNTTVSGSHLTCLFAYLVDDYCLDTLAEDCDDGFDNPLFDLAIILRIPLMNEFVPTCTITLRVDIGNDRDEDAFCKAHCAATYEATFTKADFDGCFDEDFVPFTLTRTSNVCTASNGLGLLCGSTLPATITIRPA